MPSFCLVDPETGEILAAGDAVLSDIGLQRVPGRDTIVLMPAYDQATQYWTPVGESFEIETRPKLVPDQMMIEADGIDLVSLPIPIGTVVIGMQGEGLSSIDDGVFEFTTAEPGIYRFRLRPPFPAQEQELEITADG